MSENTNTSNTNVRYYEQVIESIKELITKGELQVGDKLPSERDLAEEFGVSRVPVREALKILEYMGVLDSSPGDGTYVKNQTIEDIVSRIDFMVTATADAMSDLVELRVCLETFAAYQAAHRRTDKDIEDMQKSIAEMRKAKKVEDNDEESIARLRRLSHQFHYCMVKASHNSILTGIYENLYELLDISRHFTISNSGISYNSILAHEAVFYKIVQRDAEGAQSSMQEHLTEVKSNLISQLSETGKQGVFRKINIAKPKE